jgi:hypothetical protein
MAGFAAVPDAVRAAGVVMGDAVGLLRGADVGSPVSELAAALPGSVSAGAATDYAGAWKTDFGAWCDQAADQADNMSRIAANYSGTEVGVTDSFSAGSR